MVYASTLKRNERSFFPFCAPKKERDGSGELMEMMTFVHGHILGPDAVSSERDLKFSKDLRPYSELDMNSCRYHYLFKRSNEIPGFEKASCCFWKLERCLVLL